jgi:hypothetical protein
MGTFRSLQQYRECWKKRAKELRKQGANTSLEAAQMLVAQARSMAPIKTGATMAGINYRKKGKGYVVESTVPSEFKQNMWANQTAPFRSNKRMGVYGEANHNYTGTPRFFHLATLRVQKMFLKLARNNVRKALRVNVG